MPGHDVEALPHRSEHRGGDFRIGGEPGAYFPIGSATAAWGQLIDSTKNRPNCRIVSWMPSTLPGRW